MLNYWPRWISAIRKRTMSLSLAQMGAYDRLLDHYYAEEKPLPADLGECCRIAGAISKPEREAVQAVLGRYFKLGPDGYSNERADEEILLALPKIAAAQANGKRGGRPKKPKAEPNGNPAGNPAATQSESSPTPSPEIQVDVLPPDSAGECAADGFVPTEAGLVCRALKTAGIADVNPGHPRLTLLLQAGATLDEFKAFAAAAADKTAPFLWLLGAVEGERKRVASTAGQLHRGPMPGRQPTAAEQRALDAVPGIAAAHLRQQPQPVIAEVFDVAPIRLG